MVSVHTSKENELITFPFLTNAILVDAKSFKNEKIT